MASLGSIPNVGRRLRNPQHRFYLEHMPFQLQPFMIAPVLPAETLKNGLLQARVVTDPIVNKLIGWWQEYYFFYVKLRDLDGREDFTGMMLDLEYDMSSYNEAAAILYNHFGGSINWAKLCLKRVVETYFRDPEVAWDAYTINGMPSGAINVETFMQSALLSDGYKLNDPVIATETAGVLDNTEITASEVQKALQTWQFQSANNLTEMTFDDFLRTYGISVPKAEFHRPELLRYVRNWQYPSNTVNPENGSVASAVSWAIRESLDKDRFFREPGFIFGVTTCRPKVYLKNLDGSAVDLMNGALSWLPAFMRDDPWSLLMSIPHDAGPMQTVVTDTDGYWVDIKDLLLYGDDFVNVVCSNPGLNMVTFSSVDLSNKDYPMDADVDALFVGSTDAVRQVC